MGAHGTGSAIIEVDHLSKHYGEVRAVDEVSFSVAQGEILGLLGHNGAGKTTTIRMLTGRARPFMVAAKDPDPRRTLFAHLLEDLGCAGAVIHWSSYEKIVIQNAARDPRYAEFRDGLEALLPRQRDLGKAVDRWVFDKGFHGKWSLKKVYPVLVPGADADAIQEGSGVVSYDDLDGVAKGDEAAMLLLEYVRPETAEERRTEIRRQLLQYCELDTWATVEVLRALRG